MSGSLLESVWPEWELLEPLGYGSFSTVFRACLRSDPARQAAIKITEYPGEGASRESGKTVFTKEMYKQAEASVREKQQYMDRLRGIPNIVRIEDRVLKPGADGIGFTLYVRMELLEPLGAYLSGRSLKESEVIRMGISLCQALEGCHRAGLLHRDVKPENILVDTRHPPGVRYLLGDFGSITGISGDREADEMEGTLNYMAPEAAEHKGVDIRADLYSLGLTLYSLMNQRRLPFLPDRQFHSHEEKVLALKMRLSGIPLPLPKDASPAFRHVILKACAFDPNQRYASAREMEKALSAALKKTMRAEKAQEKPGHSLLLPALATGLTLVLLLLLFNPRRPAEHPAAEETAVPLLAVSQVSRPDALADQVETLTRVLARESLLPGANSLPRFPRSLSRLSAATSVPVLLPLPAESGSDVFFPMNDPGWDVWKTTAGGKVISFLWQEGKNGYAAAEKLPPGAPIQCIEMERLFRGECTVRITAMLEPTGQKLRACSIQFFPDSSGRGLDFQAVPEEESQPWRLTVFPEWRPEATVYYDRDGFPVRVDYMGTSWFDPKEFEEIDGLEWIS